MTLREFLEHKAKTAKYGKRTDFTFTIMKAVKDDNTPFYHDEFYQTPIRIISDWLNGTSIDNYIVITPDSMPIDITGCWCNWYKKGHLLCCIVTTIEALELKYKGKQLQDVIDYYNIKAIKHFDNLEYDFEV